MCRIIPHGQRQVKEEHSFTPSSWKTHMWGFLRGPHCMCVHIFTDCEYWTVPICVLAVHMWAEIPGYSLVAGLYVAVCVWNKTSRTLCAAVLIPIPRRAWILYAFINIRLCVFACVCFYMWVFVVFISVPFITICQMCECFICAHMKMCPHVSYSFSAAAESLQITHRLRAACEMKSGHFQFLLLISLYNTQCWAFKQISRKLTCVSEWVWTDL